MKNREYSYRREFRNNRSTYQNINATDENSSSAAAT
jgi:hypothetical protein